jgi:hypothetical protein
VESRRRGSCHTLGKAHEISYSEAPPAIRSGAQEASPSPSVRPTLSMPPLTEPDLKIILTIGHSTRPLESFFEMLKAHSVNLLVDVRTLPRSHRNPQFNQESLPQFLAASRIRYVHLPGLGGLRRPRRDSVNTGWRNSSFRGYADYMQTAAFEANVTKLLALAQNRRLALMCAEAVPWRCHRSLIADALCVRDCKVEHIISLTRCIPHELTPWARVEGLRITYPSESLPLDLKLSE